MNWYVRKGVLMMLIFSACTATKHIKDEEAEWVDLDTFIVHANPQPIVYKGSEKRSNDLLHMKLDVSFDWDSSFVFGHALLDVKPYKWPVSKLVLDAQGFVIHEVKTGIEDSLQEARYEYDGKKLTIDLGRSYTGQDQYKVSIKYTAMPDRRKTTLGTAIRSDKGLYFVRPDVEDRRSWQIWTQGETEANSAWFPTIDAPNERMTQEILITADTMYETLSNGLLLFETDNADGTKTAYWKQDLGHAPYLAMIAVGDFAVVKDEWKGIEVSYYLDKSHEQYAGSIFGHTPEMLTYFSDQLRYDYPWAKFSQVTVKEFVSGAMENTTAVVHGDFLLQTDRERLDRDYEEYIAHELFHQWFGDLVTCESWANLPLNESFATYGEYLWINHKYGSDAAGYQLYQDLKSYLTEATNYPKKLIRFDYEETDDLFDRHSYQKGGLVLHMLRNYLGDEVFFGALHHYLSRYAYSAVEVHQLRMIFEEESGEDLTWFFDQWFFSAGHPELSIQWDYPDSLGRAKMTVKQMQGLKNKGLYRLPVSVDLYWGDRVERKQVEVDEAEEVFYFDVSARPDLINFDAEKILVCEKEDTKPLKEWSYMYRHAPLFADRYEAIDKLAALEDTLAMSIVVEALDDPFWKIREKALLSIGHAVEYGQQEQVKDKLIMLSQNDPKSLVRSAAIDALSHHYDDENLVGLYAGAVNDSSYEVISSAIVALVAKDEKKGMQAARQLESEANESIIRTVADLYGRKGQAREHDYFLKVKDKMTGFNRFSFLISYADYLERQNDSITILGLNVLGDICLEEDTWWIRIAAVNAIKDLQKKFETRKTSTETKMKSTKEDNPNKAIYREMLMSTEAVLDQIENLIKKLRNNEDNDKVIKVMEG